MYVITVSFLTLCHLNVKNDMISILCVFNIFNIVSKIQFKNLYCTHLCFCKKSTLALFTSRKYKGANGTNKRKISLTKEVNYGRLNSEEKQNEPARKHKETEEKQGSI